MRLDRRFSTPSGVWSWRLALWAIHPRMLPEKGRFLEPKSPSGQNARPRSGIEEETEGVTLVSTHHRPPAIPIAAVHPPAIPIAPLHCESILLAS